MKFFSFSFLKEFLGFFVGLFLLLAVFYAGYSLGLSSLEAMHEKQYRRGVSEMSKERMRIERKIDSLRDVLRSYPPGDTVLLELEGF